MATEIAEVFSNTIGINKVTVDQFSASIGRRQHLQLTQGPGFIKLDLQLAKELASALEAWAFAQEANPS